MTIEEARALVESAYDLGAAWEKNEVRRGLEIMEKYEDDVCVDGEHDIIYAAKFNEAITEADARALIALGWHIDAACDRWAHF